MDTSSAEAQDLKAGRAEISASVGRISKKTAGRLGIEPGLRLQDTKSHRSRVASLTGGAVGLLVEQRLPWPSRARRRSC